MSAANEPLAASDPLPLPGFPADAVPFAIRTALALVLAYGVSFLIQLDSASSAGVCVAIVAQPSPGMALSKAIYRTLGTLLGGAVSLALIAAFPQDRTMLLLCFTFWLAACTFVAALLRDFRAYGAVLCGYTVGIIAISGIDAPNSALLTTLDRVAAILIGVASVAVVNLALSPPVAFRQLSAELHAQFATMRGLAADALAGRPVPDTIGPAAHILSLRAEATYAAGENVGGAGRRTGAMDAIIGLLGMLAAIRALGSEAPSAAARATLAAAASALAAGAYAAPATEGVATPADMFFAERAGELLRNAGLVEAGLHLLEHGGRAHRIRLPVHYDQAGAAISAIRTMIAVGAGCVFCVLSGWPGVTTLLVQQAAFTALLGMQPHPTQAGAAMGWALIPAAIAAWLVGYVLLPSVSGFTPFAIAVGGTAFLFALAGRLPALQRFSAGMLLYFVLLLAPANQESFDLSSFGNNVLIQVVAVAFMLVAFQFVLPVSRQRRLLRLADAIEQDMRRSWQGRAERPQRILLGYDRLAQAVTWAGRPTPARIGVLRRLEAMVQLDGEFHRGWTAGPDAAAAIASADPDRIEAAAANLLGRSGAPLAIAGLHAAAHLIRTQGRAFRHYGVARG